MLDLSLNYTTVWSNWYLPSNSQCIFHGLFVVQNPFESLIRCLMSIFNTLLIVLILSGKRHFGEKTSHHSLDHYDELWIKGVSHTSNHINTNAIYCCSKVSKNISTVTARPLAGNALTITSSSTRWESFASPNCKDTSITAVSELIRSMIMF